MDFMRNHSKHTELIKNKHQAKSKLISFTKIPVKMKAIVLFSLIASSFAGVVHQQQGVALGATQVGYAAAPAAIAAAPAVATYASGAPQKYSHSIPAAAIRNVETVGVTKTITPVVTKTTTTRVHSEPAISVGQVQGYTQSAQGAPQVAPVQFNTQYTSYINPTVGVNGPVTYAGPAAQTGVPVAAAAPVALAAGPAIGYAGQGVGLAAGPAIGYAGQGFGLAAGPAIGYAGQAGLGLYTVQPSFAAVQQFAYAPAVAGVPAKAAYAAAPVAAYGQQHHHH